MTTLPICPVWLKVQLLAYNLCLRLAIMYIMSIFRHSYLCIMTLVTQVVLLLSMMTQVVLILTMWLRLSCFCLNVQQATCTYIMFFGNTAT